MDYANPDDFAYDIVLGFKQHALRQKWDVDVITVTNQMQEDEKYDCFMLRNGYLHSRNVLFPMPSP